MRTNQTVKECLFDCDRLVADVEKSVSKVKEAFGTLKMCETSTAIFAPMGTRAFAIISKTARQCECKTMHFLFVNRDGRTRCTDCDAQYRRESNGTS